MYLNSFVKRANNTIRSYEAPMKYLTSRGLSDSDINKFSIGYVKYVHIKDDKSDDYKYLYNKSYSFNYLKNKIIFPLKNTIGNVNGIITRDLEKKIYMQYFLSEAKDIGAFFGLYEAIDHIKKSGKVFVHEGAFDAISFSKVFPNTVSSLTSFLNEQQYETLKFLVDKIILVYDNDDAGKTGIKKMLDYYGDKNIEVVSIGDEDSNSYLKFLGEDKFKSYIKSKIPHYLL